jgi:hypothetical protein
MSFLRKLIAVLCAIAVLWVALTPASSAQLWVILLPFLLFVGILAITTLERRPEESAPPQLGCVAVLSSRAPPLA